MIVVERMLGDADLARVVAEINGASWDEDNEIGEYDVATLRRYLRSQDTVFVTCHEVAGHRRKLLGIASGRLEPKPYDSERWLYVDEVEVAADQRRRGAASAIMSKLFDIARESGCTEVWLATEVDNAAANALYSGLEPTERDAIVGYGWTL